MCPTFLRSPRGSLVLYAWLLVVGSLLAACGGESAEAGAADADALALEDTIAFDAGDGGPLAEDVPGDAAEDGVTGDAPFVDTEDASDAGPQPVDVQPDRIRRDVPPPPPTCFDREQPAPEPEITLVHRCSAAGDGDYTIYDLQDPTCADHPATMPDSPPGVSVRLEDVIVTAIFGDTVYVQTAEGGAYSGIALYFADLSTDGYAVGDRVTVEGGAYEFFDLTQVWVQSDQRLGAGTPPAPLRIAHPAHVADDGPLAEAFEGVLVELADLCVHNITIDCPADFGEFEVTGGLRVDDAGETTYGPCVGDDLARVTGILTYTFGHSKIEPRDDEDWELAAQGAGTCDRKCDCIVGPESAETGELVVTEFLVDPFGADGEAEYIEIYNPNPYVVDLRRWSIADCTGQWHDIASDEAVRVPPQGYAVLGVSDDPWANGGVPVDYAYGEAFYLPNSVGTVLLFDDAKDLVDQVRYETFDPWPTETGHALELCDPTADNHLPDSWATATSSYGDDAGFGTPGYENDSTDCP